jgi:uncharacterized protein (TIGR03083 family)
MTNRASVPATQVSAIDRVRTLTQLTIAIGQLVEMLRTVRDPDAPATDRWTVADMAAHVAGNLEVCTAMVRGIPSPAGSIDAIGALNDLVIATLAERDIDRLCEHIEAHAAAYIDAIGMLEGDPVVPWHAHLHVRASTLAGLSLGEAIVHGLDIARASNQPWPVEADWARTVFRAALPVLPYYLNADRAGSRQMRVDVRLRGDEAARAILVFDRGRLTAVDAESRNPSEVREPAAGSSTPTGRSDCYVSADPWTLVRVLYGRSGLGVPIATGKIVAWGRKPWLGLRLPGYFRAP